MTRAESLRLDTEGSSWFSSEHDRKGRLVAGQLADLAVLSADYFSIADEEIRGLESVLTMVGGSVVYAAKPFERLAPPALPVSPDWSPVSRYGGYQHAGGHTAPAGVVSTAGQIAHRRRPGRGSPAGGWLPRSSPSPLRCGCFAVFSRAGDQVCAISACISPGGARF